MSGQIKISIIIPMYNARDYIVHCVDALLEQTLKDIEIIVVDDCSTDDSMAICEERYKDNDCVVLLSQPKNMGPGAARNAGIEKARGEYISFVDSDDAMVKDAFRQMYEEASRTDADVLHTGGALIPFDKNPGSDLSQMPEDKLIKILLDGDGGGGGDADDFRRYTKPIGQMAEPRLSLEYLEQALPPTVSAG